MAGLGNVGAGLYRHLAGNRDLLESRTGCAPEIRRVALRNPSLPRPVQPPADIVTTDWRDLISDPSCGILIELMGGTGAALEFFRAALDSGRPVITGNKALLAEHGAELFDRAAKTGSKIYFEAAAAGGIPIIKTIREALVGNHVISLHGILNGTSNYILTRMNEAGLDFETALAEATALGYAEADPTLDINGWDAAHKAIILASLAYGFWVNHREVHVEGIEKITARDIRFASELGYAIKLLAVIKAHPAANVEVRLHPALIPKGAMLASVRGVFNAVAVEGDVVGTTLFYGRGAGPDATASAVLSDIADACLGLQGATAAPSFQPHGLYGTLTPIGEVVSRFYLRLAVTDRPGVLARIADILGRLGIGILSVIQPEGRPDEEACLVLMLHDTPFARMREACSAIAALDCVNAEPHLMWVENPPSA